jgi:hypothetical protein
MTEKLLPTPTNVDAAFKVIVSMRNFILDMYHSGKITGEEAGELFARTEDLSLISREVEMHKKYGGVMPLCSETARLCCMDLKMAPTEDPK